MIGRACNGAQSPQPSRVMSVNSAGARGRWLNLPKEICGAVPKSVLDNSEGWSIGPQKSAEDVVGSNAEGPNGSR
jgi:hypothetical protein